ncbi:unnamed protein product, partial [Rotaria sp. Silwood2]
MLESSVNEEEAATQRVPPTTLSLQSIFASNENENIEGITWICYFRAFKQVLLKTKYHNDIAKNEMIEICRNYYRKNKKELLNIDQFEQTYKSEDAIYWYTKQAFVYRLVNKALRIEYYEAIYEEFKEQNGNSNIILSYRGLKLSSAEINNLKYIGQTIATNGFLSTSRSRDVAYTFARKGTKRSEVETVILEISCDMTKLTVPFIDIAQFSDYPEEQKILFDLGPSFTINSTHYDIDQKIWFVKLTAVSEIQLSKYTQVLLEKYRLEKYMNILLGKLLYKMEQYSVCRKSFEKLFDFYGNEEYEKLAEIYEFIGQAYANEYDYDKAIVNYTKAYGYYSKSSQFQHAAKITNFIGDMYLENNDKENARFYCTKSHDMWKELPIYTSENSHCLFANLIKLYGRLEDSKQIARDYFLKALRIYENSFQMCNHTEHDQSIAQLCEYIADGYHQEDDDNNAYQYIMKSVTIRREYASSTKDRSDLFNCLEMCRNIYAKTHNSFSSVLKYEWLDLFNSDVTRLFHHCKDLLDARDEIQKSLDFHLIPKEIHAAKRLEHSLKRLKFILKTDPENDEEIIQVHCQVGDEYKITQDYNWSIQHYKKVSEIYQTNALNNSKLILPLFKALANINLKKNDFDNAVYFQMQLSEIDEGSYHFTEKQREAQCYFNLSNKLFETNFDKTVEFMNRCLEIRLQIFPEDHVAIGDCHENIGSAYAKKSMFDEATKHFKKAIEIYETHLFDEEIYQFDLRKPYGRCLDDITDIYLKQNNYDNAFYFQMKLRKIEEKSCFVTEKEREAQCYYDFGSKLTATNSDKALEFINKSLRI